MFRKGQEIEVEISDYAFEGKGIARINYRDDAKKFIVFVNQAYPGDIAKVMITKVKKSFAEAKIVELIKSSDDRTKAVCKHFGVCGGCKSQDLQYSVQVAYKEKQVRDIFERLGGLTNFEFLPIQSSENYFNYRNKMEYTFSNKRWITNKEIEKGVEISDRDFALGLHIPRIYDKVVDIYECHLQPKIGDKILNFTRDFFKSRKTTVFSTTTQEGFLRNLVIKSGAASKDLMVNLVTSSENDELIHEFSDSLQSHFPEITTFVQNINLKKSQTAFGDYEKIWFGSGQITDKIDDKTYKISSNSFFQTNTPQATKLFQIAVEFADFTKTDSVYDLYSGAGTIAIYIADKVKTVFAVESVDDAVGDAKQNMKLNNIENIVFVKADLNKSILPKIEEMKITKPDVIIADPPRAGMNPNTVKDILTLQPQKVVYISCNPTTQVRDINLLSEKYDLIKIQPVDMFPHTYHIENVALLKLKSI